MQMNPQLYSTHIPTSSLQKLLLAGGSAIMALAQPQRGGTRRYSLTLTPPTTALTDMVATMGETTAIRPILQHLHDRMAADVSGQRLLL